MNARILFVLCLSFLSRAGYAVEPIVQLSGASNWSEAAGMAAEGSGVAIDSVINFDGENAWLHLRIPTGVPRVLYIDNPNVRNYEIISLGSGKFYTAEGLMLGWHPALFSTLIFYIQYQKPGVMISCCASTG